MRGVEKAKQQQQSIEATLNKQKNFLDLALTSFDLYEFQNENYHQKKKEDEVALREALLYENKDFLVRTRREKKTINSTMDFAALEREVLNPFKDKTEKKKVIKLPDHHLYLNKERLIELLTKEMEARSKMKVVKGRREDGGGVRREEEGRKREDEGLKKEGEGIEEEGGSREEKEEGGKREEEGRRKKEELNKEGGVMEEEGVRQEEEGRRREKEGSQHEGEGVEEDGGKKEEDEEGSKREEGEEKDGRKERKDEEEVLSFEEVEEKNRLMATGFPNWTKAEFTLFVQGCERFGRESLDDISKMIESKKREEITEYGK